MPLSRVEDDRRRPTLDGFLGGLRGVSCWRSHSIRSEISDKRCGRRLSLRRGARTVTNTDLFSLRLTSILSDGLRMFFFLDNKKTESAATAEIALDGCHYAVRGRSRSVIEVPIELLHATLMCTSYFPPFWSYCEVLVQLSVLTGGTSF